jgi:hypothetical protein
MRVLRETFCYCCLNWVCEFVAGCEKWFVDCLAFSVLKIGCVVLPVIRFGFAGFGKRLMRSWCTGLWLWWDCCEFLGRLCVFCRLWLWISAGNGCENWPPLLWLCRLSFIMLWSGFLKGNRIPWLGENETNLFLNLGYRWIWKWDWNEKDVKELDGGKRVQYWWDVNRLYFFGFLINKEIIYKKMKKRINIQTWTYLKKWDN